jgi:hypothetical protein
MEDPVYNAKAARLSGKIRNRKARNHTFLPVPVAD